MKKSIEVEIVKIENGFKVSNNQGKVWSIPCEGQVSDDESVRGCIASLAGAMLTGTISSILRKRNSSKISFTLTMNSYGKDEI